MNSKISTNVFEEAGITPETLIKLGLPQDSRSLSPMMVHYCQTKCAYKDSILFYRLGDFYEMFFEDAKTVSRELELTLTGKDCGLSERAPMCGIPYHAAETYINRLIDKGYKVAICEQVEDPKTAKGIVKREVTRVVTPGTNLNMQELDEGKNNYLMAIVCVGDHFGVSTADITTGDCYVTEIDEERKLWDEINKFLPAEIICNDAFLVSGVDVDDLRNRLHISVFALESWYFGDDLCKQTLLEHFKISSLEGLGLADYDSGVIAAGSLFRYLLDTQKNTMEHMNKIIPYTTDRYMVIDSSSRRNLELVETLREKQKRGSLLWVLDKTKTAMGARMLRNFVEQPLIDADAINERLDAVTELNMQAMLREEIREYLNPVYDLERLVSRISYRSANPRDLLAFKSSLEMIPHIKNLLANFTSPLLVRINEQMDGLEDLYSLLEASITEDPPLAVKEGGIIREGYNEQVDTYRNSKTQGKSWLAQLEAEEKEKTGIRNLKIKYNKVFGYYLEVTNSFKDLVPEYYTRKQTLTNAERYITPKLKELEDMILGAEDKLFATLDPTTRDLKLPSGQEILMTDTVGFIRKLPHHLIEAFRSTLEEAKYADIILHVVDASNPQMDEQMYTVYETLQNLGVKDKPVITVFNKIDRMEDTWVPRDLRADYHVKISAKTGEGITGFLQSIEAVLRERKVEIEALYPYKEAGKIQKIRKYGELQEEEYREDGIFVRAFVPAELYGQVRPEGVTPNNCL